MKKWLYLIAAVAAFLLFPVILTVAVFVLKIALFIGAAYLIGKMLMKVAREADNE